MRTFASMTVKSSRRFVCAQQVTHFSLENKKYNRSAFVFRYKSRVAGVFCGAIGCRDCDAGKMGLLVMAIMPAITVSVMNNSLVNRRESRFIRHRIKNGCAPTFGARLHHLVAAEITPLDCIPLRAVTVS
jgi:hypothetical protein